MISICGDKAFRAEAEARSITDLSVGLYSTECMKGSE